MLDFKMGMLIMALAVSIMFIGMALVIDDNDFGPVLARRKERLREIHWSTKVSVLRSLLKFAKLFETKRDIQKEYETCIDFYFFNVTNPVDVERGGKPILEEVGPYQYKDDNYKIELPEPNEKLERYKDRVKKLALVVESHSQLDQPIRFTGL